MDNKQLLRLLFMIREFVVKKRPHAWGQHAHTVLAYQSLGPSQAQPGWEGSIITITCKLTLVLQEHAYNTNYVIGKQSSPIPHVSQRTISLGAFESSFLHLMHMISVVVSSTTSGRKNKFILHDRSWYPTQQVHWSLRKSMAVKQLHD